MTDPFDCGAPLRGDAFQFVARLQKAGVILTITAEDAGMTSGDMVGRRLISCRDQVLAWFWMDRITRRVVLDVEKMWPDARLVASPSKYDPENTRDLYDFTRRTQEGSVYRVSSNLTDDHVRSSSDEYLAVRLDQLKILGSSSMEAALIGFTACRFPFTP